SSTRNGVALTFTGPRRSAPGMTMSMFCPRLAMSLVTRAVAERPSETIAMTEPTPITMPSVVRTERMTLRLISRSAMSRVESHTSGLRRRVGGVAQDQPVLELDDAPRPARDVRLVRDHHDGDAARAVEV